MAVVREDWLKLVQEDVIAPDLPICDPHHHLWYQAENSYVLEEFLNDISGGHCIVQTVFVESRMMLRNEGPDEMKPVGETEYVQKLVSPRQNEKTAVAAGMVGFADLTLGSAVAPVLEAQITTGKGRVRGIRYTTARDPRNEAKSRFQVQSSLLADSKFREGFACLQKYGLSFDAWLFHPQIMELVALARAFPDTTIILDHVGGPLGIGFYALRREEMFHDWKTGIDSLSTCPNVYIKLGGLGMEISGFNWYELPTPPGSAELAKAYAPYFLHCIEKFGTGRCMFESNFPVDKQSYPYDIIWNAFKRLTKDFSYSERRNLFYDTAVKVYHLVGNTD
jgi:predicted TIM-barrel fold metal-dependent hydrolase